MKRAFFLMVAVCITIMMLCSGAAATDTSKEDVNLRISAQLKDGTVIHVADYKDFADGWNHAISLTSQDNLKKSGFSLIIVDLYSDWVAKDGEFSNSGTGFNWDAIYIPEGRKVVLNLNGNTIDRGLDEYQYNGEVICVGDKAELIINGGASAEDPTTGTIKGGFSCNGAGGIHINDKAKVTLNNVNVSANWVEHDDGAAIALYNEASLVVNGGSFSDNVISTPSAPQLFPDSYGTVFVKESTAAFNNVTFSGNMHHSHSSPGTAVYVKDSKVTLNNCTIRDNSPLNRNKSIYSSWALFFVNGGSLTLEDTEITNNGAENNMAKTMYESFFTQAVFNVRKGSLTLNNCNIHDDKLENVFEMGKKGVLKVTDSTFTDNNNIIYFGECGSGSYFENCTFNNNGKGPLNTSTDRQVFEFEESQDLTFTNCDFGDSTFSNKEYVTIKNAAAANTASIFGAGSPGMIISLTVLAMSVMLFSVIKLDNKRRNAAAAVKTGDDKE